MSRKITFDDFLFSLCYHQDDITKQIIIFNKDSSEFKILNRELLTKWCGCIISSKRKRTKSFIVFDVIRRNLKVLQKRGIVVYIDQKKDLYLYETYKSKLQISTPDKLVIPFDIHHVMPSSKTMLYEKIDELMTIHKEINNKIDILLEYEDEEPACKYRKQDEDDLSFILRNICK